MVNGIQCAQKELTIGNETDFEDIIQYGILDLINDNEVASTPSNNQNNKFHEKEGGENFILIFSSIARRYSPTGSKSSTNNSKK